MTPLINLIGISLELSSLTASLTIFAELLNLINISSFLKPIGLIRSSKGMNLLLISEGWNKYRSFMCIIVPFLLYRSNATIKLLSTISFNA